MPLGQILPFCACGGRTGQTKGTEGRRRVPRLSQHHAQGCRNRVSLLLTSALATLGRTAVTSLPSKASLRLSPHGLDPARMAPKAAPMAGVGDQDPSSGTSLAAALGPTTPRWSLVHHQTNKQINKHTYKRGSAPEGNTKGKYELPRRRMAREKWPFLTPALLLDLETI